MRNQGTLKAHRRRLMREVRRATGLPLPVCAKVAALYTKGGFFSWWHDATSRPSPGSAARVMPFTGKVLAPMSETESVLFAATCVEWSACCSNPSHGDTASFEFKGPKGMWHA